MLVVARLNEVQYSYEDRQDEAGIFSIWIFVHVLSSTYIYTIKNGWTYLASILDMCTRKIVGWSYSMSMTTELTLTALANAGGAAVDRKEDVCFCQDYDEIEDEVYDEDDDSDN